MKVFGIDPGSERTGYGCVESDGSRHVLVRCGAITTSALTSFPDKLRTIHAELSALLDECRPDSVAIESVFFATNVRSALKLGHARGVRPGREAPDSADGQADAGTARATVTARCR